MATRPFFAKGGKWEALTLGEKVGCVRFRDRLVGEDWPEECLTAPDAGITVARFVTAYVLSEPMPEEARESSVLRCDRCSALSTAEKMERHQASERSGCKKAAAGECAPMAARGSLAAAAASDDACDYCDFAFAG